MPYVSNAERESASLMTWTQLLSHVRTVEQCDDAEARRQIANAIGDRKLFPRWSDKRPSKSIPGIGNPFVTELPVGAAGCVIEDIEAPRDTAYWRECEIDSADPDRVREPQPYDPKLVDGHTAKLIDEHRLFRRPVFDRRAAMKLWPAIQSSDAGRPLTGKAPGEPVTQRRAALEKIDGAITAVYDDAAAAQSKSPNVRELVPLVKKKLAAEGYDATYQKIQDKAADPKHKKRRRSPGRTVAADRRVKETS